MQVGVVTAYVPLPVKHLTPMQYLDLGVRIQNVCKAKAQWLCFEHKLELCWAYDLCTGLPPNNPVPADRYDTPEINVMSNIVQHNRTTWAMQAMQEFPDIDVWVWFDFGLLKQGFWKNNPITEATVARFLDRVADTKTMNCIPFPGIADKATVYPTGNNWRFCGSTHIWPKAYLPAIDAAYKGVLRDWVKAYKTVPLDLPIWALVENLHNELPFRWYPAEYDATQLDNYPGDVS